ncbi:hypothetical protein [Tsukamurella sp. NPDC003166]|uniref:ORC-CDC6 family AAA ATPase n=1 Tax=Tsukamurella sp. NPDC003166 TaxID=3154444 RepID=UPI0033BA218F
MTDEAIRSNAAERVKSVLGDAGIRKSDVQIRDFPDELFVIVSVEQDYAATVGTLTGAMEDAVSSESGLDGAAITVLVRVESSGSLDPDLPGENARVGRLSGPKVEQLVKLMGARSRTSISVPSFQYKEDPRTSVSAAAEARNHLIFGRRGVGKTALLLEVKRTVEQRGEAQRWVNMHVLRELSPEDAFASIMSDVLGEIASHLSDASPKAEQIRELSRKHRDGENDARDLPRVNSVLREILVPGTLAFYLLIDDFYLYPAESQPKLLDLLAASFRDCNAWIKVASIERLTRAFESSTRTGLEVPHDAIVINLDVTLENPRDTQEFLESITQSYVASVGISSTRALAKPEASGRLVLSSGGVPRDYLNLFSNSILVARKSRESAAEIGSQDVAKAAGEYSQSKKRDLEQDVGAVESERMLEFLENLLSEVKGAHYTYFRVDYSQKEHSNYEYLARLVDFRFCHLIQSMVSDQHRAGVKYEAYLLALSEYSDVRVQRNLNVLDIVGGEWVAKTTGVAGAPKSLKGTQLRDRLRSAPVVNLDSL